MKLYATTTSERASKGQGGNDYIKILLQAGKNQAKVGQIDMTLENNELVIDFTNDELITTNLVREYLKAEKKKDDCILCKFTKNIDIDKNGLCGYCR